MCAFLYLENKRSDTLVSFLNDNNEPIVKLPFLSYHTNQSSCYFPFRHPHHPAITSLLSRFITVHIVMLNLFQHLIELW